MTSDSLEPTGEKQLQPTLDPQNIGPSSRPSFSFISLVVSILFLLLGGAGGFYLADHKELLSFLNFQTEKGCTLEAKICPDGTSVGRSGPNCEFAACPTLPPDPTANWKSYSDNVLAATFKYPPNWTLVSGREIDKILHIWEVSVIDRQYTDPQCLTGDCPSFGINIDEKDNSAHLSLETIIKNDFKQSSITVEDISSNGITYKKVLGAPGGAHFYLYTNLNDKTYILHPYSGIDGVRDDENNPKTKADLKIFDQILSTFKFIDQATSGSTVNWNLFTDKDYPFQIGYPNGWNLRTTYGKSVGNTGNDRIAGIDISNNLTYGSTVVVNVIDPKNNSFDQWMKLYSGQTNVPQQTNYNYLGNQAYRFEIAREGRPNMVQVYYQYKDMIIFIAWNVSSVTDQSTADQIISTLKFL